MAMRDRTKQMFARALEEMMRTETLENIRIKDLCARCGAQRQSFYYHFQDKYDLIAWIFLQDSEEEVGIASNEADAASVLRRIEAKRGFYKKAFSDDSQNAIHQYMLDYYIALSFETVSKYIGKEALDTETTYVIKSHCFACIGHTKEWLMGKTGYTPEEFARLQTSTMPPVLKRAYELKREHLNAQ